MVVGGGKGKGRGEKRKSAASAFGTVSCRLSYKRSAIFYISLSGIMRYAKIFIPSPLPLQRE